MGARRGCGLLRTAGTGCDSGPLVRWHYPATGFESYNQILEPVSSGSQWTHANDDGGETCPRPGATIVSRGCICRISPCEDCCSCALESRESLQCCLLQGPVRRRTSR